MDKKEKVYTDHGFKMEDFCPHCGARVYLSWYKGESFLYDKDEEGHECKGKDN